MNLAEVARFIEEQPATVRLVYPQAGQEGEPQAVFYARASGKNKLAWLYAGGQAFDGAGALVHEIIPVNENVVRVRIDDPYVENVAEFERLTKTEDIEEWNTAHEDMEQAEEMAEPVNIVDTELERLLRTIPESWPEPTKKYWWARWTQFDFEADAMIPAGVLVADSDGSVTAFPCRGFESQADALNGVNFGGKGKEGLDQASRYAGRLANVAAPESIKGTDYVHAVQRARMQFAADYYQETGRTIYFT